MVDWLTLLYIYDAWRLSASSEELDQEQEDNEGNTVENLQIQVGWLFFVDFLEFLNALHLSFLVFLFSFAGFFEVLSLLYGVLSHLT